MTVKKTTCHSWSQWYSADEDLSTYARNTDISSIITGGRAPVPLWM